MTAGSPHHLSQAVFHKFSEFLRFLHFFSLRFLAKIMSFFRIANPNPTSFKIPEKIVSPLATKNQCCPKVAPSQGPVCDFGGNQLLGNRIRCKQGSLQVFGSVLLYGSQESKSGQAASASTTEPSCFTFPLFYF